MNYQIATVADMYGGKWLVIRTDDMRLVHETHDIYEAVAWIRTWGWRQKTGREISPRFLGAVDWALRPGTSIAVDAPGLQHHQAGPLRSARSA